MDITSDRRITTSMTRLAALIAEKRRTRARLVLGSIEAGVAEARLRSLEAELAREWDAVRQGRRRPRPGA